MRVECFNPRPHLVRHVIRAHPSLTGADFFDPDNYTASMLQSCAALSYILRALKAEASLI